MLHKYSLLSGLALTAVFCVSAAMGAGRIVVSPGELASSGYNSLVMLPDGSVLHLARLRLSALFDVHAAGDTLIYDVDADSMAVRRNVSPSELLLDEPLTPVLIEPATFAGINVTNDVALYEAASSYFYSSFPGYPYQAAALDGMNRLIFVGTIAIPYASYQSSLNPFQPDDDFDGVPSAADNCIFVANGPLIPDLGNNIQLDADGDGYGNACDADLTNDGVVNGLDVGPFTTQFGTAGPDADLNGDGVVNGLDVGPFVGMFGQAPGPSGLVP